MHRGKFVCVFREVLELFRFNLWRTLTSSAVFPGNTFLHLEFGLPVLMLFACWAANLCTSENITPVSSACSAATYNNNPLIKCHPA